MLKVANEYDFNSGYYAVKFGATWCAPCKRLEPLFNKMEDEFNNIKFISIDVDQAPTLAQKYKIRTVPTILLIKNGYEKTRIPGLVLIDSLRTVFRELVGNTSFVESCVA